MAVDFIGTEILGYRITEHIAEGGMGSVWRAEHPDLGKVRAIKLLDPMLARDGDLVERFVQEARTQVNLGQHPNIVQVENFSRDPLAMVMDFVEGDTLADVVGLKVGPIPLDRALPWIMQILAAVEHAHGQLQPVVHRDIKPSNIIVTREGTVRVMDFGIAKVMGGATVTRTGQSMGTAAYMSPEQVKGARDVDARSDIYALGGTFYEMLAGRPPFLGSRDSDNDFEIREAQVRHDPPDPRTFYEHIPEAVVQVLLRCLAKLPEDRFQTAVELREAFEAATGWVQSAADGVDAASVQTPAPVSDPAPAIVAQVTPAPTRTEPRLEVLDSAPPAATTIESPDVLGISEVPTASQQIVADKGRSRGMAVAIGVVSVLGMALVIGLVLMGGDDKEPATPRTVETKDEESDDEDDEDDEGDSTPAVSSGSKQGAAKTGGSSGQPETTPPPVKQAVTQITWVSIPRGRFMMGSTESTEDELPVHQVNMPAFQMSKSEVTVAQYRKCVERGRCRKPRQGPICNYDVPGRDNHPVNCVSWKHSKKFCSWAGGDLPSEAQWEYAARSGSRNWRFPWGNQMPTCDYAVLGHPRGPCLESDPCGCGKNSTWPVCSKPKGNTVHGLCDMGGNLFEWLADCWSPSYHGAPTNGSTWDQVDCNRRFMRGGSWGARAKNLRAAFRYPYPPARKYQEFYGFRCARRPR